MIAGSLAAATRDTSLGGRNFTVEKTEPKDKGKGLSSFAVSVGEKLFLMAAVVMNQKRGKKKKKLGLQ